MPCTPSHVDRVRQDDISVGESTRQGQLLRRPHQNVSHIRKGRKDSNRYAGGVCLCTSMCVCVRESQGEGEGGGTPSPFVTPLFLTLSISNMDVSLWNDHCSHAHAHTPHHTTPRSHAHTLLSLVVSTTGVSHVFIGSRAVVSHP